MPTGPLLAGASLAVGGIDMVYFGTAVFLAAMIGFDAVVLRR